MGKKISSIILALLLPAGCSLIYPTTVPIKSIHYTQKRMSKTLFVLLPGRRSAPADFKKEGFIEILNKIHDKPDIIAVDAHFGYYIKRNLLERLLEDIIKPARKQGYKKIWIIGISMGGTGALLYSQQHHVTINGVLLIAPYQGDKDLVDEISGAHGLARWLPQKPIKESDYQRKIWQWLKKYTTVEKKRLPKLAIGFGNEDRFAPANRLLANVLPARQVFKVSGGHDWDAWRQVLKLCVEKGLFK